MSLRDATAQTLCHGGTGHLTTPHLVISYDGCLQLTAAASLFPERSSSVASHVEAPTIPFAAVVGDLIATEAEQTGPVASAHSRSSDSSLVDPLREMFAARLTVAPVRLEKLQESEVKLKTRPSKSLMRCMCKASSYYHCLSGLHSQEVGEPRTCRQRLQV